MPTIERVSDQIIAKPIEKPIPTVTVSTRSQPRAPDSGQYIKSDTQAPEESVGTTEESVRLSPQLSAIARKEQAFRQRELALKTREKEIEDKLAKADKYDQLTTKMSAKDYSDAEELGLTYEEYTKHVLNKQDLEDPEKKRVQNVEDELKALKKGLEEQAAQQFEETKAEYQTEIKKLVATDPEFSSIKEFEGEAAVLQLILDTFDEDGEELTISEACKLVEDQLVEKGKKYTSLPKFKKEELPEKVLPRPVVGKTLTNNMVAGSDTKRPVKSLQHLSENERYAEARRRVLERQQKG